MHRVLAHPIAISAALAGVSLLLLASLVSTSFLLFNHSPSIPIGFYLRQHRPLTTGVIVTVRARDVAPAMARLRDFEEDHDRFIKRVAAIGGQTVCSDGATLLVDGRETAVIYQAAELPALSLWEGCRSLSADEVLLLGDSPDSFDGRYWGPINRRLIEGVWRPL